MPRRPWRPAPGSWAQPAWLRWPRAAPSRPSVAAAEVIVAGAGRVLDRRSHQLPYLASASSGITRASPPAAARGLDRAPVAERRATAKLTAWLDRLVPDPERPKGLRSPRRTGRRSPATRRTAVSCQRRPGRHLCEYGYRSCACQPRTRAEVVGLQRKRCRISCARALAPLCVAELRRLPDPGPAAGADPGPPPVPAQAADPAATLAERTRRHHAMVHQLLAEGSARVTIVVSISSYTLTRRTRACAVERGEMPDERVGNGWDESVRGCGP
jgi:hypothetical protein